jgi:hypothetical protein
MGGGQLADSHVSPAEYPTRLAGMVVPVVGLIVVVVDDDVELSDWTCPPAAAGRLGGEEEE